MKQLYQEKDVTLSDIKEGLIFGKRLNYVDEGRAYISFFKRFDDWDKIPVSYAYIADLANRLCYLLDKNMFSVRSDYLSGEIITLNNEFWGIMASYVANTAEAVWSQREGIWGFFPRHKLDAQEEVYGKLE